MNMTQNNPTGNDYRRYPLLAVLLSLAATGLGHIYCGRLIKGLILFFIGFVFAPVIVSAAYHAGSTLVLVSVVFSIVVILAISVYALVDAGLLAHRIGKGYHLREFNRWPLYLLFIVVSVGYPTNLASTIRQDVVQIYKTPSRSMAPGLKPGNRVLLNKTAYKISPVKKGDAVIFFYPDDRRKSYLKRVVALPGDLVEIRNNIVFVNNESLEQSAGSFENFVDDSKKPYLHYMEEHNEQARYPILVDTQTPESRPPIMVPHGYCYVLGDNRSESVDSRHFGPVPLTDIQGRLDYIIWPPGDWVRFGKTALN